MLVRVTYVWVLLCYMKNFLVSTEYSTQIYTLPFDVHQTHPMKMITLSGKDSGAHIRNS